MRDNYLATCLATSIEQACTDLEVIHNETGLDVTDAIAALDNALRVAARVGMEQNVIMFR